MDAEIAALIESVKRSAVIFPNEVEKSITFLNTPGPLNIFTVTGRVYLRIFGVITVNLASAGGCNAEVGVGVDTDAIIDTTDVTTLVAFEIWAGPVAPTPGHLEIIDLSSYVPIFLISNGNDIILTLNNQIDSGAITFYCEWIAKSTDGNVVAA